jgi:hypothetical protein
MSNTSRRRATTSRRRITMAAGALLAGAAIPIAAAGTAWADDTDTPNQTETVGQLQRQGLTTDQALAVVHAERHDIAVAVSYDGTTVVDANQRGTSGDASATTSVGSTKDVAAAIGGGSDSTATGGPNDRAFADGTNSTAQVEGASDSRATAIGTGSDAYVANQSGTGTLSHDIATDTGGGSAQIYTQGAASGNLTYDVATASAGALARIDASVSIGAAENADGDLTHDTATASGVCASCTNPTGSVAVITGGGNEPVSDDTATATKGGYAIVENFGVADTLAVTHDTATADNGSAGVFDAGSSRAVALNTGPATFTYAADGTIAGFTAGASVLYATDSTATAANAASIASVSGRGFIDSNITDSHAIDLNGTSTVVRTSDTLEIMGIHSAVTPEVVSGPSGAETVAVPVHVEMTPVVDVHVMPAMPLP